MNKDQLQTLASLRKEAAEIDAAVVVSHPYDTPKKRLARVTIQFSDGRAITREECDTEDGLLFLHTELITERKRIREATPTMRGDLGRTFALLKAADSALCDLNAYVSKVPDQPRPFADDVHRAATEIEEYLEACHELVSPN